MQAEAENLGLPTMNAKLNLDKVVAVLPFGRWAAAFRPFSAATTDLRSPPLQLQFPI
jgi:hypothetical protein